MTLSPVRSLGLIEATQLLRIHPHTLRKRARAGLIPGAKIGRSWAVAQYANNVRKNP